MSATRPSSSDAERGELNALVEELRAVDRKNAEELRALRLPIEREPVFVFRAARPSRR